MKNVITAIGNPNLNEKLCTEKEIKLICKDIQYREAILEIMQYNKNIDLIIISDNIVGDISFDELIQNIKSINNNIEIIFILEKENDNFRNILIKNNVHKIYSNNEINLNELINIIKKEKMLFSEDNKIENYIENYNKKIDVLSGLEFINNKEIKDNLDINKLLDNLKKMYNNIIIEITAEINLKIEKQIIQKCDKILFLSEGNLLEINRTNNIINNYINKFEINKNKIEVIFNKYNKKNIHIQIIKKILQDYCVLGKINYNENYNYLINNKYKNIFIKNIIKMDYIKFKK